MYGQAVDKVPNDMPSIEGPAGIKILAVGVCNMFHRLHHMHVTSCFIDMDCLLVHCPYQLHKHFWFCVLVNNARELFHAYNIILNMYITCPLCLIY